MSDVRKARDLALLDAIDALPREVLRKTVWRVAREGRDPLLGASSYSRWCNASFDVLYASFERDGAIAEAHALLLSQPVFPTKPNWFVHQITVGCDRLLRIADWEVLRRLGVDTAAFRGRDYGRTQEIADAAYFLDFDGLLAPSARWECTNLVVFTDKLGSDALVGVKCDGKPIDWSSWRASRSK
jgi:RES domain-containing protein